MPDADSLIQITLRDLPEVMAIERIMRTPGEMARLGDVEFQRRIDIASVAYFGVTEADTRLLYPDHLNVNGCNADYTLENQRRVEEAQFDWNLFDQSFDPLKAGHFPKKSRFSDLADRGLDVRAADGKPLLCWPYFGRQAIAALDELFEESKFDPDAKCRAESSSAEDWGEALTRAAELFRPKR